ncbi:MAG: hypothetical protein KIT84_18075 [Labilithrix sp.]|nr:hypothetical protein [Labilithrix sp.]MCW5812941.1 hypothetical protein [Labilithrix sp.]
MSSFLSGGGGYGAQYNDATNRFRQTGAASFGLGVGTDPLRRAVLGGMLRSTTFFGLGTDLGLSIRIATGGFARGDWGLAFDAGAAWRSFGRGEYGRWPITARITGGGPWGLQLAVAGDVLKVAGNDAQARGVVAVLELDLLRLTVMRQGSSEKWWPNPAPAGGRVQETAKNGPLAGLLW